MELAEVLETEAILYGDSKPKSARENEFRRRMTAAREALITHLSTAPCPAGTAMQGWRTVARDGMPPCDSETVFTGINTAGFAACFNEVTPDGCCSMQGPELSTVQMSGLCWWQVLDRPAAPKVDQQESPTC